MLVDEYPSYCWWYFFSNVKVVYKAYFINVETDGYDKERGYSNMTKVMCQIRSYGITCTWQHLNQVGATAVSWGMLLLAFASNTKTDKCHRPSVVLKQANLKSAYLNFFNSLFLPLSVISLIKNCAQHDSSGTYSKIHNLVIFKECYSISNPTPFFFRCQLNILKSYCNTLEAEM